MEGPVVVSSDTGSGQFADEVLLAATLRLLARSGRLTTVAVSRDPRVSERLHPGPCYVPAEELGGTLAGAAQLVVVGRLQQHDNLERAATHVARAKLAGIPVAAVSVLVDARAGAGLDLVAQCDALSAGDHASAQCLESLAGRRVEITAPLEFVLPQQHVRRRLVVQVCQDMWLSMSSADRQALEQALEQLAHDEGVQIEFLEGRAGTALADVGGWARAIASARVHVGIEGSTSAALALLHGVVSIGWQPIPGARLGLHERMGLSALQLQVGATSTDWQVALKRAWRYAEAELRSRTLPLVAVAWRAVGSLSEAVRSISLRLEELAAPSRSLLAATLGGQAQAALKRGDAQACEAILEPWRAGLETEPRWAEARARAFVLLGCDQEARKTLETALEAHPDDVACHAALAMVTWRLGDFQVSQRALQRVSSLEAGGDTAACAAEQLQCMQWLAGRGERHPESGPWRQQTEGLVAERSATQLDPKP